MSLVELGNTGSKQVQPGYDINFRGVFSLKCINLITQLKDLKWPIYLLYVFAQICCIASKFSLELLRCIHQRFWNKTRKHTYVKCSCSHTYSVKCVFVNIKLIYNLNIYKLTLRLFFIFLKLL